MSPADAPEGTVVVLGHPANGHLVKKYGGRWLTLNANGREIADDEIERSGQVVAGPLMGGQPVVGL